MIPCARGKVPFNKGAFGSLGSAQTQGLSRCVFQRRVVFSHEHNKKSDAPSITLLRKPYIGARVGPHRCPILQYKEKQDYDTSWHMQLSMYNHPGTGDQSRRNH